MDVMFSIPVYFTSNVSKNLRSVICKFCEDLNLISYMSVFIGGCKKFMDSKSFWDVLLRRQLSSGIKSLSSARFKVEKGLNPETDMFLSFRPTYIEVSIKTEESTEQFYIGVKAFPYTLGSAKDVIKVMDNILDIGTDYYKKIKILLKYELDKIFGKSPSDGPVMSKIYDSWVYRGLVKDINVAELIKSNRRGKGEVKILTYGFAILKYELEKLNMNENEIISKYEDMSNKGVGDLFIIDDVGESLIFCNKKLGYCDEKQFSDLATLLKKEDLSVSISGSNVTFSPALKYIVNKLK